MASNVALINTNSWSGIQPSILAGEILEGSWRQLRCYIRPYRQMGAGIVTYIKKYEIAN
jgi:hypothetical protein